MWCVLVGVDMWCVLVCTFVYVVSVGRGAISMYGLCVGRNGYVVCVGGGGWIHSTRGGNTATKVHGVH